METCVICLEDMADEYMISYCDHKFHRTCIEEWSRVKTAKHEPVFCPVCRHTPLFLCPNYPEKKLRKLFMDTRYVLKETKFKLEQTINITSGMIAELVEERNQYGEKIDDLQLRLKTLEREYELLKNKNEFCS